MKTGKFGTAVGWSDAIKIGCAVGLAVSAAVGDDVVGRGYGDLVAPNKMNLFCILA